MSGEFVPLFIDRDVIPCVNEVEEVTGLHGPELIKEWEMVFDAIKQRKRDANSAL